MFLDRLLNITLWTVVLVPGACIPMQNTPTGNANDNSAEEPTSPFAVFEDPQTGFKTTDLYDADGQIVRFNAAGDTLIFAADGATMDGWSVHDIFFDANEVFQARFGTDNGVQRAYFTESGPATICNVESQDGVIFIFPTEQTVPQT